MRRKKQRKREEEMIKRNRVSDKDIVTNIGNGELGRIVRQLLRKVGLWGESNKISGSRKTYCILNHVILPYSLKKT